MFENSVLVLFLFISAFTSTYGIVGQRTTHPGRTWIVQGERKMSRFLFWEKWKEKVHFCLGKGEVVRLAQVTKSLEKLDDSNKRKRGLRSVRLTMCHQLTVLHDASARYTIECQP